MTRLPPTIVYRVGTSPINSQTQIGPSQRYFEWSGFLQFSRTSQLAATPGLPATGGFGVAFPFRCISLAFSGNIQVACLELETPGISAL